MSTARNHRCKVCRHNIGGIEQITADLQDALGEVNTLPPSGAVGDIAQVRSTLVYKIEKSLALVNRYCTACCPPSLTGGA